MLNRRHLRVKVLQVLYAFFQSANDDLANGEKELFFNINKTYDLYLYKLLLISEMGFIAEKHLDERKNSVLYSKIDARPDSVFLENFLLQKLRNSTQLEKACKKRNISWSGNHDIIRKIFFLFRKSELYRDYTKSDVLSFEKDKKLIIKLYETYICNFELLHHFFEEKSIYWIDDWELVVIMTIKTLKNLQNENDDINLISLFKEEDDKEFARQLFNKTVLNHTSFDPMISEKTKNWDIERIAIIDIILMKMALTELLKFPEIPVKVTLNEYIELSKMYSSKKSKVFINGVLDKLVVDLEKENKIKKAGKGLISKTNT